MVLSKKFMVSAFLILVALLSILAIGDLDYNISKAIISPGSYWAGFFNLFGEVPAISGMLIGTVILFGARRKERLWSNILGTVIALPFMALFSYMIVLTPVRYFYEFSEGGIPTFAKMGVVVGASILFLLTLMIVKRTETHRFRELRKVGVILLVLVVAEMILVNVLKVVWGRPRMRSMESIEQFKHWYSLNGPAAGEEFKSFPSGHTANGFVMLAYTMFIPYLKNINSKVFVGFTVFWGCAVALSRVVMGAHFLSDVLVGSYITILIYFALSATILGKKMRDKKEGVLDYEAGNI